MENVEKTMGNMEKTHLDLLREIRFIKECHPKIILPDNLQSLSVNELKTIYDYHMIKINDKNEINHLINSYLKIMYIFQCFYLTLIKDKSKYEELDMLRPKGVRLKLNKSELYDKIIELFQNFKTDLITCKNKPLSEDEHEVRFIDAILQLDDIHNIDLILNIIKRCDCDDVFTFY